MDTNIVGIPEENIVVSLNETKSKIIEKLYNIEEATKNSNKNLFVYYSGHGYMEDSGGKYGLFLTTRYTNTKKITQEAIKIEEFVERIRNSNSKRKIIILDACYSGEIHLAGAMGDANAQIKAEINKFEGSFVMTSASKDNPALFPEDKTDEPTYFTGEFINVLENGINSKTKELSTKDVFKQVENSLNRKKLPKPQASNFLNAGEMLFAQNRSFDEDKEKLKEIEEYTNKADEFIANEEYKFAELLLEKALKIAETLKNKNNIITEINKNLKVCKYRPKYKPFFEQLYKNEYSKKIIILKEEQKELKELIKREEENTTTQKNKINILNKKIADKEFKINQIGTNTKENNNKLKNEKDKIEIELQEAKNKLASKISYIDSLKQENKTNTDRFEIEKIKLQQELQNIEKTLKEKETELKYIKNNFHENKGDYELLVKQKNNLEQEIIKNKTDIKRLKIENKKYKNEIQKLQTNLQTLKNKNGVLLKENQILTKNVNTVVKQKLKKNYTIIAPIILLILILIFWQPWKINTKDIEIIIAEPIKESFVKIKNKKEIAFANYTEKILDSEFEMIAIKGEL